MRVKSYHTFMHDRRQYLRLFLKDGQNLVGGLDIALPAVFQSKEFPRKTIDLTIAMMYQRLGEKATAEEHYRRFIENEAEDSPHRRIAEKSKEDLKNMIGKSRDVKVERIDVDDQYSTLRVIGERDAIEEMVRRYYRNEFVGQDPLSQTEYIRTRYRLEDDVELPLNVKTALDAQKKANEIIREINNSYLFMFLHNRSNAREDLCAAKLGNSKDALDAERIFSEAKAEYNANKKLLSKIADSEMTKEQMITTISSVIPYDTIEMISSEFMELFRGLENTRRPNHKSYKTLHNIATETIEDIIRQSEWQKNVAGGSDIKCTSAKGLSRTQRNKMADILAVPEDVFFRMIDLAQLKTIAEQTLREYGCKANIDWEDGCLKLRLDNFPLSTIEQGKKDLTGNDSADDGCTHLAYDIETLGWIGSSLDPGGLRPEIFLAAICAESGTFDENNLLIDKDAPEETIRQIAMKYKDIVVGTQDIGTGHIETGLSNRKARYILTPDQQVLRRVVADIMFYKNPSNTGGNNHDAFDLPRTMTPRRILTNNEKAHYKGIEKLANEPDGIFNPNPDNSGPTYVSQTWKQKFRLVAKNKDFLNISKNYLRSLTTDSKLETVGALLDFFEDFGLGYGKIFHSYKEMELSAVKGKNGDREEAYKNAKYCYEDNIAQLRLMMFFDRIMEDAAHRLQMDSATLYNDPKSKIASMFWDSELFMKTGMPRRVDEETQYRDVTPEKEKKDLLKWGMEKDDRDTAKSGSQLMFDFAKLSSTIKTDANLTRDCTLYITPTLSEGLAEIINNNERLTGLQKMIKASPDPIERIILQQILDGILIEPRIDLLRVKAGNRGMNDTDFKRKYSVDVQTVRRTMARNIEQVAESLRGTQVAAYDGNIIALKGARPEGFIEIAHADVLSIGEGEFIYRMKKDEKQIFATRGVGVPSMKRRHSADYIFDGFQPNFIIALEHDFVQKCFDDPQDSVKMTREITHKIIKGQLEVSEYLMTLKPGHNIEEYSLPYRRTKRFKVIDLLGIKHGEKKTFVCVEDASDELIFKEVNPDNVDELKDVAMNKEFYLKWLGRASPKIARLENAVRNSLK